MGLRFQVAREELDLGFDFLGEVRREDFLAGIAVFQGVLPGALFAFVGYGALGFLAILAGGRALRVGGFADSWP